MSFLINAVNSNQHCWQIGAVLKVIASLFGLQKRKEKYCCGYLVGQSKKSHILQSEDRTNREDLFPENTILKRLP